MGSIDQHLDVLRGEISRQPLGAAEAADPHRNRLGGRAGRAAGQRKYYLEIGVGSRGVPPVGAPRSCRRV